jgi:hypothetical protein
MDLNWGVRARRGGRAGGTSPGPGGAGAVTWKTTDHFLISAELPQPDHVNTDHEGPASAVAPRLPHETPTRPTFPRY